MNKSAGGQMEGLGGGWPDGRYVMVGKDAKMLVVISDPLDNVKPKPELWLSKDFFSIEKPRLIAVQFPEATNSWKLMRASETNDWQLADAQADEKLDPAKISSVTSPFNAASFNDVLPADTKPENSSLTNVTSLKVETFDGFTYLAKIGSKQADIYPVAISVTAQLPTDRVVGAGEKPEDQAKRDEEFKNRQKNLREKLVREKALEHWIFQMPAYAIDSTIKSKDQLLTELKKETAAAAEK